MNLNRDLQALCMPMNFKAKRVSSYDVTGGNVDAWLHIAPGEVRVLADIEGPSVISHIWMTMASIDEYYLRKILLRIYWDDEENPSVLCPIGDFFGLGHARPYTYQCAAFSTTGDKENEGVLGKGAAMNCWLPMPFKKRARIEIVNEQEVDFQGIYFYIDYQEHPSLPKEVYYFHAYWRRENPCNGWTGKGSVWWSEDWKERSEGAEGINLSDKDNYLLLEAEGKGNFIGVNMSVDHVSKGWWGEGDDMIFVDRDDENAWPPDLHGTGSEDYICQAWGTQKAAHLYSGMSWNEEEDHQNFGKVCVYRHHLVDPIPFEKNIRVSIEHGHANDRSDDYASVAYWYQNEPHKEFPPILPAKSRVPNSI